MKALFILASTFLFLSCSTTSLRGPKSIDAGEAYGDEIRLPHLKATTDELSVSGLSSGAFMAGQLGVIHSSRFKGVGIIAGGPFFCSQGDANKAVNICMKAPEQTDIQQLIKIVRTSAANGDIDALTNLRKQKIVVLHGKNDPTVKFPSAQKISEFYETQKTPILASWTDSPMGHGFPTPNGPVKCDLTTSPFMNNCDGFDGAGFVLKNLHTNISEKRPFVPEHLKRFSQQEFGSEDSGMEDYGFIYIPTGCESESGCRLHVALHGCKQYPRTGPGFQGLGTQYVEKTGYLDWAEANRIVVLFPESAPAGGPGQNQRMNNPFGCWDWFGFSGKEFATKDGKQIRTIMKMVDRLTM